MIIIIYKVNYAHGLSVQIHEQCLFFTFSTVAFWVNKHEV